MEQWATPGLEEAGINVRRAGHCCFALFMRSANNKKNMDYLKLCILEGTHGGYLTLTHNSSGTWRRQRVRGGPGNQWWSLSFLSYVWVCVRVCTCWHVCVCLLNSKNDTWGQGASGRDITLVRTVDWGHGWDCVCVCVCVCRSIIRHYIWQASSIGDPALNHRSSLPLHLIMMMNDQTLASILRTLSGRWAKNKGSKLSEAD